MATFTALRSQPMEARTATDAPVPRLRPVWTGTEQLEPAYAPLVDGCIAQDRRSQQRVYELFYGKMMAVCLRYTKNTDQAKDILQEAFIKVFRSVDKFNRAGSFEGWIRRIMVNTAIDHFRRTKNAYLLLGEERSIEDFRDVDEDDNVADDGPDEEFNVQPADVINAMQKLTPAYRTVFNLYVFEEMTHKEIADALGINVGTSKSNLAKAKHNLKKILKKEHKLP